MESKSATATVTGDCCECNTPTSWSSNRNRGSHRGLCAACWSAYVKARREMRRERLAAKA